MPVINNATVATGTGLSTAGGGRKIVRLANGALISATRNSTSISLYKSSDNGTTWAILPNANTVSYPSVQDTAIVSKGDITYRLFAHSNTTVVITGFDANGNSVAGSGVTLDTSQTAIGNVSLAINDAGTELHAAWSSKNATYSFSFNIRYAKGIINGDGSVTWGAVEQVTALGSTTYSLISPSITLNGAGKVNISSVLSSSGSNQQGVFSFTNADTNKVTEPINGINFNVKSDWGSRIIFNPGVNAYTQSNPVFIFIPQSINGLANGRLWVAWHGKDATDSAKFNARVSYSDDGGVTWATPVKLTSGNLYDRQNVSLAADKTGKVFALYEEHQWSPDLDIYMRTFSGGSWGAPVAVAEADPAAESNPSALFDYSLMMTTPPFVFMSGTDGIKFSGNFNVGASVSPASGALGNKETATLTAYTVTPEAGSTVTSIVEKVNGVTVNTYNNPASLSRTLTVPTATWDTLAYFAALTASITVTDSNGATTVTTYSFDKRLATGASLLEATKANTDAKNRMRSQLDAISTRVGVANGSSTNQIISAIDARNVVKRQNGTAVVSGGQIVVNTLGFLPKTITIRSSATQNGTYSELLGTNESRNGTTITQNAFTNISATGFTALISGTNVTWEAQG